MVRVAVLGLCVLLVACDKESPPPAPTPQPTPGTEQITGRERIGWDQPAATTAELAAFRYLIHVDNNVTAELQGVRCDSTPGAEGFVCSADLPSMSPGAHTLALSAFREEGTRLESTRSPQLSVIVVGQTTTSRTSSQPGQAILATIDGVRLHATVAVRGLDEPTDLAFAADGRIFVAERAGRIRVFHNGRLLPEPAVILRDVLATDRDGLLAIALDPDFDRTRFVYAIYTAGSGFRLARLRAAGDTLGDHVVLMDAVAPPGRRPSAALRFGPDAKLYVGVDDGDIVSLAGDLGSFSGKVLRLNAEGTTPADQAGGTPVFALSVNRPRGLDWDSSGALWIVERDRLQTVVDETRPERRGSTVARYSLPEGTGASALGFYRGDLFPRFRGDLFIAADDDRSILRLRFDRAHPTKIVSTERLLLDTFDSVRAIGIGRDGAIYFCTSDALIRMAPELAVDRR